MASLPQNDPSRLLEEAVKIVESGKDRRIPLRIFGAVAIVYHCPNYRYLFREMARQPGDIDLASYEKFSSGIAEILATMGYEEDLTVTAFGGGRLIFRRGSTGLHCDVFLGKLQMSHT